MDKAWSKTRIMTFSALIIALYVVIMYATQSFAFGAYQIRVATGLYSLSYLFPFLVIPLGLANSLSNLMGGNLMDVLGGALAGIVTSGSIYLIRRFRLPQLLIIPVIIFGPGLLVPIWLSQILGIPYAALAVNICIGQIVPGVLGYIMVKALSKHRLLAFDK